MKKTNGVVISFLLGSAIGSAAALLFAPKSGKRLRNDISRKTNEIINDGRNLASGTWDGAKEMAENTFDSANEFLKKGINKITK